MWEKCRHGRQYFLQLIPLTMVHLFQLHFISRIFFTCSQNFLVFFSVLLCTHMLSTTISLCFPLIFSPPCIVFLSLFSLSQQFPLHSLAFCYIFQCFNLFSVISRYSSAFLWDFLAVLICNVLWWSLGCALPSKETLLWSKDAIYWKYSQNKCPSQVCSGEASLIPPILFMPWNNIMGLI